MPETENEVTTEITEAPAEATTETPPDKAALGDAGKLAIQREREARKTAEAKAKESERQNGELAARLKAIEDRDKSETQKLADQVAELQKAMAQKEVDLTKAQQEKLRVEVAKEKGVPASSLTGSTQEELEASADEVLAWRDASKPTPPRKPATAAGMKSGASSASDGPADPKERAASAIRALRNGT